MLSVPLVLSARNSTVTKPRRFEAARRLGLEFSQLFAWAMAETPYLASWTAPAVPGFRVVAWRVSTTPGFGERP